MVSIQVDGAKEAAAVLEKCSKEYEKQARSFLNKQGNALKKRVLARADENGVGQVTGNFRNAVTRQTAYKYYLENPGNAKDSTKVYGRRTGHSNRKTGYGGASPAPAGKTAYPNGYDYKGNHTHLIEYGHEIKGFYARKTSKTRTRAFDVYKDGLSDYEGVFEGACESFVNEITKDM